tara:strand:- start:400 stop:1119 length:720 start_codon:yes stop_codon:yes gene_type:complete
MKNYPFEKNYPSLSYIVNNWPKTKPLLKRFVLSNHKKPEFYKMSINLLNDMNIKKMGNFKLVLKKLSKISSLNPTYNTYHDQHHFKTVLIISCLLAKLINLDRKDRLLLVVIALAHDLLHSGRRILKLPYYQELKSFSHLKYILSKTIFKYKDLKRIQRIFQSTFFLIKPKNVNDNLEKIILDADVLASLMFGMETGVEFARRLKHEIRFEDDSKLLFEGFLKLIKNKSLYLDSSKKSC